MVLPLAHRMMHLLTVLSLSQGCVNLGKISSKILDKQDANYRFWYNSHLPGMYVKSVNNSYNTLWEILFQQITLLYSARELFQKRMNAILKGIQCWIDDILVLRCDQN